MKKQYPEIINIEYAYNNVDRNLLMTCIYLKKLNFFNEKKEFKEVLFTLKKQYDPKTVKGWNSENCKLYFLSEDKLHIERELEPKEVYVLGEAIGRYNEKNQQLKEDLEKEKEWRESEEDLKVGKKKK